MTSTGPTRGEPRQLALLVFSWLLVGLPLLWGLVQTIQKAALLFK